MKPASDQETSPLTFGRYEALLRIGRGGMAEVYAGRVRGEAGFQKLVAIKRMLPHLAEDERFSAMFLDEARLAAHISSPYVVTTHDLGRADDGSLYLVMELVVGSTLSSFLRSAARHGTCIPLPVAVEVLAQTAQGLHDAHEAKTALGDRLEIVHRDVSPQNILIGVDGRARITDFGVARAMMRRSDTSTGELKGKLAYFSPEQVKDGQLDRRSDIFALGIVAWETFTSRRLFKADNPLALLDRIMNMPIPSTQRFNPDVPDAVDAAVQRALSRDLDQRYPDGMAFAMALRAAYSECGSRKEVSAYVRSEAKDRIDRMEDSLRTALARGDQPSNPPPNDVRSGITHRDRLAQVKAEASPEKPAVDQTTAAADGPQTRRLKPNDLGQKTQDLDTISVSALRPHEANHETVGLDAVAEEEELDLDAYDDGPTFAMEHAPVFDDAPIRDDQPALQSFDEAAMALAAEPTVAVDPYDLSNAPGPGAQQAPASFAQAAPSSAELRSSQIPWKVIGLIGGIAIAIAIGIAMFSLLGDERRSPAPVTGEGANPFSDPAALGGAESAAEPAGVQADKPAAEEIEPPKELLPPERTSAQELLEELKSKRAQASEEKIPRREEKSAARTPSASTSKSTTRRTASRPSKSTASKSTASKSTASKSTASKSTAEPKKAAAEDEKKHGSSGIRLDF